HPDHSRSDENGTAAAFFRRRDDRGGPLPRGRVGATRNGAGGARVNLEALRGRHVIVVEVGPRDGLQNEQVTISTADKIAFVDLLSAARLPVIEVSAFVSPKWVPQMADASEVFAGINRRPDTRYTALVPNVAGLDRALAAGVR